MTYCDICNNAIFATFTIHVCFLPSIQTGEFNTGGFPKGLAIMLGMVNHWIYDKPALDGVRFEAPLKELKDDLAVSLLVL